MEIVLQKWDTTIYNYSMVENVENLRQNLKTVVKILAIKFTFFFEILTIWEIILTIFDVVRTILDIAGTILEIDLT